MRVAPLIALLVCVLACCSRASEVCPAGWTEDAYSEGDCAPPASFVASVRQSLGTGIYGFVRTDANGRHMVGGAKVFAEADGPSSCRSPGTNAVATITTDQSGVFQVALPAGSYYLASDAVTACRRADVASGTVTPLSLTMEVE